MVVEIKTRPPYFLFKAHLFCFKVQDYKFPAIWYPNGADFYQNINKDIDAINEGRMRLLLATGAVNVPIYQTSTFVQDAPGVAPALAEVCPCCLEKGRKWALVLMFAFKNKTTRP